MCWCVGFLCLSHISMATGFDEYQLNFQKNIGEVGGQCIVYVRAETGIEWSCCHGDAQKCYSQAKSCGYPTGDIPVIGSIMVMGPWSSSSVGHDAIVIAIDNGNTARVKVRDSNWGLDEKIQEHWINTAGTTYGWFKYVYPKNQNSSGNSSGNGSGDSSYFYVSEGNVHIAWSPSNVPCNKASVWSYNQTCSAENSHPEICNTAHYQLLQENYNEYSKDKYNTMFFGSISDFQQFCQ